VRAAVEIIAGRVEGDRFRYLVARRACQAGEDPDATAKAAFAHALRPIALRRVVLHSTSWRYADGTLTLTYLGYSDAIPFDDLPLVLPRNAPETGDDIASVAAHAIRHLAFLNRKDPDAFAKRLSPAALSYLARLSPDVAGRIYPERAA
jgi:hypothetical protein